MVVGVVGGKLESGVINDSRVLATAVVKMGSVEEPSERYAHVSTYEILTMKFIII